MKSKLFRRTWDVLHPRTRWRSFRQAPHLFREHHRYALRQALLTDRALPLWVTAPSGARFYLSADPIDDRIAAQIILNPEFILPPLSGTVPGDGIILNVGGHHGLYAAEALTRYPDRDLVVVEPHPDWCQIIKKQIDGNDSTGRGRVINGCLATDNGSRLLRFDEDSSWGATVHPNGKGTVTVEVPSLTLGQILDGRTPALIYCNAEGAEYALVPQIRGLTPLPSKMVLAVHPEFGDAAGLRREMRELGYDEENINKSDDRPIFHYTRS